MADMKPRRCKRSPAWNREQQRQHVKAQAESGLTVQDYCFAHGLKAHNFYNWRRRVRVEEQGPDETGGEPRACASPAFAELRVGSRAHFPEARAVEVLLAGERRLRVSPGFDGETLRRLVSLLESLPC